MAFKSLIAFLFLIMHQNEAVRAEEGDPKEDATGFFDMEMGKDRSLKTFYYKGGYLSIYEGRNEKLKRYYITPLTELQRNSAKCFEPGVENRYKVRFNIEMWNSEIGDEAVKALAEPPLNLEVREQHIHPLPILKVRLSVHGMSNAYEPDTVWKSNLNQRLLQTFSIYASSKEMCEKMVEEIAEEPEAFASLIQLEIAMSAEKRASRDISITGANIGKSEMFSQLQNIEQTHGEPLLTSSDLSHLAQEIVSTVVASEVITGDYVEKPDEVSFARLLERQLSSNTIDAQQLSSDQWKSVFWREEFTRPDRYTSYLTHAMTHDKGTNVFSYDKEAEAAARKRVESDIKRDSSQSNSWSAQGSVGFLGFGASAGGSSSSGSAQSNHDKNEFETDDMGHVRMSQDQLIKFLKKRDLQVEWNGEKFVPKSLDLHRVNTAQLRYRSKIATQQVQIKTVPITVKLDATVASFRENDTIGSDHMKILIDQATTELSDKLYETRNNLMRLQSEFNEMEVNISSYASEIARNHANIQNMKRPQATCHRVLTSCTVSIEPLQSIRCNEGHFMNEWHLERCGIAPDVGYRYSTYCCSA